MSSGRTDFPKAISSISRDLDMLSAHIEDHWIVSTLQQMMQTLDYIAEELDEETKASVGQEVPQSNAEAEA